MRRIAIFLIIFISISICIDHISEVHSNGMPKVIKTYNGYGKLELNKEAGYYSEGTQKYQKTYYNGEVKNIQRWDKSGKRIIENNKIYNAGWPADKKNEAINKCSSDSNITREICECMFRTISAEFSYEEYAKYDSMDMDEIPKDVLKRSEKLIEEMMKCSK